MLIRHFIYPVTLTKQSEGGYLVNFSDLPEAITQAETTEEALREAGDCLEEAIANRIAMKLEIPNPSRPKKNQYSVSLHTNVAAKAALYLAMREKKLSNMALARKLSCDEKEIRRMLDPYYYSKLPKIECALNALGQQLEIGVTRL
jgi:antitoxin HicB